MAGVCTLGLRDKGQLWGWMLLTLTSKGVLTCVFGPCPEESPGWECGPGLPGHYCAPAQPSRGSEEFTFIAWLPDRYV